MNRSGLFCIDSCGVIFLLHKKRICFFCLICLTVLILDAKTTLYGASEALQLCIKTVVPSLFPYMTLTMMLSSMAIGTRLGHRNLLCRFTGIPDGTESLLLTGFLGGYPTGAQNVATAYQQGAITKEDAQRMIGFCSNAGPAFLFGIILQKFGHLWMIFLLWLVHIVSALLTAAVLPRKATSQKAIPKAIPLSFSDAVKKSISALSLVCGWILLFRIITSFLEQWILWLLPREVQVIFFCIIDLANGCCQLNSITNDGIRFVVCAAAIGFGGICVVMQTKAVIGELNLKWYLPAKLLQCVISTLVAYVCQLLFFSEGDQWNLKLPFAILPPIFLFSVFLAKRKIILAFLSEMVYNLRKRRNEECSCYSARK